MIRFLDVEGVREIEVRFSEYEKMMKDELEEFGRDADALSLKLFGITALDVYWPPDSSTSYEEWENHFEFLEWEFEEEAAFWEVFGIDLNGDDGEQVECIEIFGRQLVSALKQLHPAASLRFRPDAPRTDAQLLAEAEAWGRNLQGK